MNTNAAKDPEGQARISSFRRSLQDLGWTESRNLRIDYRWGAGDPARAQAIADELLTLKPELIVANGSTALSALHQKTSIPVVFVVVVDPVGGGFVRTLARPGGTVTGFSTFEPEIGGKWLELLMKIRPGIRRVAGILDPDFRGFARVWNAVESLGPKHDLEISTLAFRNPGDGIESAVRDILRSRRRQVLSCCQPPLTIFTATGSSVRQAAPAACHLSFALYARSGGLSSYGIDTVDLFRRSASYVDRILKGEKPADLPVQAPTKYELVINLRTAKALGIAIPPSLQLQADELIQ
jgi:putative ABC transport system substrate-binding protein